MIGNQAPEVSYVNYTVDSADSTKVKLLLNNGTGTEVQKVLNETLLKKDGGYLARITWTQVEITINAEGGTIVATGTKPIGDETAGQPYELTIAYTHDPLDNIPLLRHRRAAEMVGAFKVDRPSTDRPWLAHDVYGRLSAMSGVCTIYNVSRLSDRRQG